MAGNRGLTRDGLPAVVEISPRSVQRAALLSVARHDLLHPSVPRVIIIHRNRLAVAILFTRAMRFSTSCSTASVPTSVRLPFESWACALDRRALVRVCRRPRHPRRAGRGGLRGLTVAPKTAVQATASKKGQPSPLFSSSPAPGVVPSRFVTILRAGTPCNAGVG
jgi:hypothetical protein